MTTAAELKELKREMEAARIDAEIAQGKFLAIARQVMVMEAERRLEKQAKCKHTFVTHTDREFEGEGFVDIEYQYCTKCKAVKEHKTVNVVVKSEK